ncbi:MAG: rhomboid family intramembrane serine protease [Actinomycetaceae bacterium]|nr:rhomboid family intramembrane serine protease [Actinomycetaceae bacterium]MDU0971086.1 rhomboid family intramembrane serine protease [Actinomycetaceae bacterium]
MIESFLSDPQAWLHAFVDQARYPLILLGIMWIVEVVASSTHHHLSRALAIRAWMPTHLWAIVTAPFAHGGWFHLFANTLPFLIFGAILSYQPTPALPPSLASVPGLASLDLFGLVTIAAMITSGLGAFFINRPGVPTVGASGLIFGYFGYIMTAGVRTGPGPEMATAVVVGGIWGLSMLRGILPRFGSKVSWQGHLFGLVGGIGTAMLLVPAAS